MKTKMEILEKYLSADEYIDLALSVQLPKILDAMEKYADQFKPKIKENNYSCKLCNESGCYGECLTRKESGK